MPLTVTCPHCRRSGSIPSRAAGQTVRCPDCKQTFSVAVPVVRRPRKSGMLLGCGISTIILLMAGSIVAVLAVVFLVARNVGEPPPEQKQNVRCPMCFTRFHVKNLDQYTQMQKMAVRKRCPMCGNSCDLMTLEIVGEKGDEPKQELPNGP